MGNLTRNVYGKSFQNPRFPWTSIGTLDATASAADAALADTERFFQTVKDLDNAVYFIIPASIANLLVRFILTTENADVDIDVWVGALAEDPSQNSAIDCDLRRLATYDVICGDQDSYDGTHQYADTATEANDLSISGCTTKTATDHMAIVHIPVEGFNVIVFHGYGTFDEDCEIELAGYS